MKLLLIYSPEYIDDVLLIMGPITTCLSFNIQIIETGRWFHDGTGHLGSPRRLRFAHICDLVRSYFQVEAKAAEIQHH